MQTATSVVGSSEEEGVVVVRHEVVRGALQRKNVLRNVRHGLDEMRLSFQKGLGSQREEFAVFLAAWQSRLGSGGAPGV